jgi:hypothetical protein
MVSLEGNWGVVQVRQEVVWIELRRKRSAEWLDCFEAVLEALIVHLERMAPVLLIAEGGTLEVHHNLLGGNRIIIAMTHNSDMLGLLLSLVVSLV